MDKLKFKGNWNIIKGRLKQHYAELTDDEWKYAEGKEHEFIGKLQQKMRESRQEIRESIKRSSSNGMDSVAG